MVSAWLYIIARQCNSTVTGEHGTCTGTYMYNTCIHVSIYMSNKPTWVEEVSQLVPGQLLVSIEVGSCKPQSISLHHVIVGQPSVSIIFLIRICMGRGKEGGRWRGGGGGREGGSWREVKGEGGREGGGGREEGGRGREGEGGRGRERGGG